MQHNVPRRHQDPETTPTEHLHTLKPRLKTLRNCNMNRAAREETSLLRDDTVSAKFRVDELFSEAAAAGTMALPVKTQTNDAKMGCRVDYGEVFERDGEKVQFNLQPNKQAENATMKNWQSKIRSRTWHRSKCKSIQSQRIPRRLRRIYSTSLRRRSMRRSSRGWKTFSACTKD
ncbi:hypothetical protein AC579_4617 [Pseudocercospora musae]|uniref:Uncharacterized protein n=1 Tax=Pseudocercospora musae TaxID=113226 RepID=A0A139H2A3_9PEZI|nr:hypothetical protein AC579_4617 [Pseudocercospora musae]